MRIAAVHSLAKKARQSAEPPVTEAVELSLRLLERLAASRMAIGVSELAREFAASKATVYRHLQTLMRHGFVHQDPSTMRYAAGIKLFILGERLRERFDIANVAREEMLRLRDRTGQMTSLSALIEDQCVWLEAWHAHTIVNFGVQPGSTMDFHASAHGRVALAFGPEALLERCLTTKLKAWTPQTVCSPAGVRRIIAQVKSRGWATAPNQYMLGLNAISAPIFNHFGAYLGAVGIGGSIQHIPASPAQEQIRAVTQAADQISQKLGWSRR